MLTHADATRTDGLLTVRLIVQSSSQYDEAIIEDYYPGTVTHPNDPSSAQIFIRVDRNPEMESRSCPLGIVKTWILSQIIHDNYHKTVEIFINDYLVRKIRILEFTVRGMYDIIDL